MRAKYLIQLIFTLALAALFLAGGMFVVQAQRDTGYTIDWWTVDGGGQTQPDGAGTIPLAAPPANRTRMGGRAADTRCPAVFGAVAVVSSILSTCP